MMTMMIDGVVAIAVKCWSIFFFFFFSFSSSVSMFFVCLLCIFFLEPFFGVCVFLSLSISLFRILALMWGTGWRVGGFIAVGELGACITVVVMVVLAWRTCGCSLYSDKYNTPLNPLQHN